ncbi:MAG: DUF3592 domain-containing protein [Alphaproteobacteria bacterium]|nr:DUF3592 domain-containing protein [Alphaproteobacteria bacterium]
MSTPSTPTARSSRFAFVLACVIGLALALAMGVGAWVKGQDYWRMITVGETTDGTITGYRQVERTGRLGRHFSTTYHPTLVYSTTDGRVIEGTTLDAMERSEIKVGSVMRVVYDPENPTDVRLAAVLQAGVDIDVWLLGGAAVVIGIASVVMLVRRRVI